MYDIYIFICIIFIYLYSENSHILLVLLCPPFRTLCTFSQRKKNTSLNHISTTHRKKQEDGTNKSIRYPMIIIQLNPSGIRMVSCLIFSANPWTPGKSSLCHALCDPFGTAACPVCHLVLKIGAFNRRFWMFACFL